MARKKAAPTKRVKRKPPRPRGAKASRDPRTAKEQYQARKERERQRQAKQSAAGRDIADGFPKCADSATRRRCDRSLKFFALEVFGEKFTREFGPDHLVALRKMERSIVEGMLFALSMPRGSGKTTLIIVAVIWAIVTGRRRYIALIGPTKKHAKAMLRTIKMAFESNDRLLALYPEACYPIRRLGRMNNRARGQLYKGKPTFIEWTKENVVLANLGRSRCGGAIVEVAGLTGSIRGMVHETPKGEALRPDLLVLDDIQTKRSARSDTQCDERLETIQGDCLGLAGPGESIAGFLLCTVIRKGDVADQLLDSETYPDWQGERFKLIYTWPNEEGQALWDQYAELRAEDLRRGKKKLPTAVAFYKKHRRKMDRGVKIGWPDRYEKKSGEISAIQHAYNLLFRDEEAFWCEFQNDPKDPEEDLDLLSVEQILAKHSGYERGTVHPSADTLTAFIDVQGKCLYWLVVAWRSDDFSGWVVDYGTWPDQKIPHFRLASVRHTLGKRYPRAGLEGRIKAGLQDLVDDLAERDFKTPGGNVHRVRRIGIDAAWGPVTKIVQDVARTHKHAALLLPAFGRGIKPTQSPIESWKAVEGELRGLKLVIRPSKGGGRHILADVNFYKTFIHARLATADGDKGSLSIPKPQRRRKTEHRMLCEHCRAEIREHIVGPERRGDVWKLKPSKPDNHLFDCLVHCAVLAAAEGVRLAEHAKPKPRRRRGYAGALAA